MQLKNFNDYRDSLTEASKIPKDEIEMAALYITLRDLGMDHYISKDLRQAKRNADRDLQMEVGETTDGNYKRWIKDLKNRKTNANFAKDWEEAKKKYKFDL